MELALQASSFGSRKRKAVAGELMRLRLRLRLLPGAAL